MIYVVFVSIQENDFYDLNVEKDSWNNKPKAQTTENEALLICGYIKKFMENACNSKFLVPKQTLKFHFLTNFLKFSCETPTDSLLKGKKKVKESTEILFVIYRSKDQLPITFKEFQ